MSKKGILLVVSSACFVASQAIFAKLAYSVGVTVMTALFLRFAFGTVALFFCLKYTRQSIQFPKDHSKLLLLLIFTHLILDIFLFEAFYLLPASLAIMFYYIYPAFTSILSYLILGDKLTSNKIIALILSGIGLFLLLTVTWSNINLVGASLAVTAALLYAGYLVCLPRLLSHVPKLSFSFWLFLISSIGYFIIGIVSSNLDFSFPCIGWIYLVCVSLISSVAATLALFYGLSLIGPTQSAIILTLEPPITALLGYLIFHEIFTGTQIIGTSLVLLAVLLSQFSYQQFYRFTSETLNKTKKPL